MQVHCTLHGSYQPARGSPLAHQLKEKSHGQTSTVTKEVKWMFQVS